MWGRAVVQNAARGSFVSCVTFLGPTRASTTFSSEASLAQLVEHALRKRMVVGSIPTTGGSSLALTAANSCANPNEPTGTARSCGYRAPSLSASECPLASSFPLPVSPLFKTVCPSGTGGGLEIHWALPAGVQIPSLSYFAQSNAVLMSSDDPAFDGAAAHGPAPRSVEKQ